jgi:hypothetical protein
LQEVPVAEHHIGRSDRNAGFVLILSDEKCGFWRNGPEPIQMLRRRDIIKQNIHQ